MKKLLTLLICIITSTIAIKGMKTESIAESCAYEVKKIILLDIAQNVHKYTYKDPTLASHTILNISYINKQLYRELDKTKNDPRVIRDMVKKYAYSSNMPGFMVLNCLKLPGAKKCLTLTQQLYCDDLDENQIKKLFDEGAFLEYYDSSKSTPLAHWGCHQNPNSINLMKKLLDLGANINAAESFRCILCNKNIEKINLALKYKPVKYYAIWRIALTEEFQHIINLLFPDSTKDDLNIGLKCYIDKGKYLPEIMQQFITHGADPKVALNHLQHLLQTNYYSLDSYDNPKKNLIFLQKALQYSSKI